MCLDSSVTNSSVPVRGRRQLGCLPRDRCTCPPGGITGDIICPCEFFKCLDPDDVVKSILGFNTEEECLALAIDTTGSMSGEIDVAKEIILNFLKSEEEIGIAGCYVLVPFNDIGPDDAIVPEESKN